MSANVRDPQVGPRTLLGRLRAALRARHYSPRTEESWEGRVSASTQNQALSARVFLYDAVLGRPLGLCAGLVRAKRSERLPVVLTRDEVRAVLAELRGTPALVAGLLYGSGLRLLEALQLR